MEIKGEILILDQGLSDLQKPVYAPDAGREVQQRDEESCGLKDADYALEIIIGNSEVEKYLHDRTRMEMAEPSPRAGLKEFYAFDRERKRRCLPPEMLTGALEASGIAEKRRLIAHELLLEQQRMLRALIHNEMLLRYTGRTIDIAEENAIHERQKWLVAQAVDKKMYMLGSFEMDDDPYLRESTKNFGTMGVKIVINPNTFIAHLAERYSVPIPEANKANNS
jgi:hypothetical protein